MKWGQRPLPLWPSERRLTLRRAMSCMYINGECVIQLGVTEDGGPWHVVIKTPRGANLCLSLQLEISSSVSAVYLQQLQFFLLTDSTKNTVMRQKDISETYILTRWKIGWALWYPWALIKILRRSGWACGWKRNVCMVFALCLPQATVPPSISLWLFPRHIMVVKLPQPAPTSDLCAKKALHYVFKPVLLFQRLFMGPVLTLLTLHSLPTSASDHP